MSSSTGSSFRFSVYRIPVLCVVRTCRSEKSIIQPIKLLDMDTSPSSESISGTLVYFLSLLVAVFLGPLEAVLGLALYSLLRNSEERRQTPG